MGSWVGILSQRIKKNPEVEVGAHNPVFSSTMYFLKVDRVLGKSMVSISPNIIHRILILFRNSYKQWSLIQNFVIACG